jgi:isoleucyl-tRNA synthetase
MDEKIINQYAFEIFSRAIILEAEFKVFVAEQFFAEIPEERKDQSVIIHNMANINGKKKDLEKLKSQIEKFRQQK